MMNLKQTIVICFAFLSSFLDKDVVRRKTLIFHHLNSDFKNWWFLFPITNISNILLFSWFFFKLSETYMPYVRVCHGRPSFGTFANMTFYYSIVHFHTWLLLLTDHFSITYIGGVHVHRLFLSWLISSIVMVHNEL